jgi:hypothetical protein
VRRALLRVAGWSLGFLVVSLLERVALTVADAQRELADDVDVDQVAGVVPCGCSRHQGVTRRSGLACGVAA